MQPFHGNCLWFYYFFTQALLKSHTFSCLVNANQVNLKQFPYFFQLWATLCSLGSSFDLPTHYVTLGSFVAIMLVTGFIFTHVNNYSTAKYNLAFAFMLVGWQGCKDLLTSRKSFLYKFHSSVACTWSATRLVAEPTGWLPILATLFQLDL